MSRDPRIDAYIDKAADFAKPILAGIRERVHAACPQVEETLRWGMPSYSYRGKILVQTAAFKAHATCGFWQCEGMDRSREGEAMGQFGRLTSLDDLPGEAVFAELVTQAMARIDEGAPARPREKKAPRPEAEVPPELAEALAADDAASATFDAFPPSCRREYCEWVAEAKRPETRAKRVAEAVAWMREGKRRNWKYENC